MLRKLKMFNSVLMNTIQKGFILNEVALLKINMTVEKRIGYILFHNLEMYVRLNTSNILRIACVTSDLSENKYNQK